MKSLYNRMKKLYQTSICLQVDYINENSSMTLHQNIAKEACQAAEVLWKLNNFSKPSKNTFHQYFQKFLEKYGVDNLIPLLDVICIHNGIGWPLHYSNENKLENIPFKKNLNDHSTIFHNFLMKYVVQAIKEGEDEIELTDKIIEKLVSGKLNYKEIPTSLELYCEIINHKLDSNDNEEKFSLLLFPNTGSIQACSSFGRFLDILPNETQRKVKNLLIKEEEKEPECLFVELSWLPFHQKLSNVAIHNNFRKFQLSLPSSSLESVKTNIELNDIYVGADPDGLFFFSKKFRKRLIFTATNMLNFGLAPNLIRFLRDVSIHKFDSFRPFEWLGFEDFSYLPRVRYNRTFLTPARWKIKLKDFSTNNNITLGKLRNSISIWLKQWNAPTLVWVTISDQRILFDISHEDHLLELARMLLTQKELVLFEKIQNKDSTRNTSEKNSYATEFVIPMVRNSVNSTSKLKNITFFDSNSKISDRFKPLGSEWIYMKIYCHPEEQNIFISLKIWPFINYLLELKLIDSWFYVRYWDKEDHIRLRFHCFSQIFFSQLLSKILNWGSELNKSGSSQKIDYSTYERELERYGGTELIATIEKVFCISSQLAISILTPSKKYASRMSFYSLMSLNILQFLKYLNLTSTEQEWILSSYPFSKNNLQNFRSHQKELIDEIKKLFDTTLNEDQKLDLKQIFDQKKLSLDSQLKIFHSLIHMHCNRILGIEREMELKACAYAYKSIKIINFLLKNTMTCKSI